MKSIPLFVQAGSLCMHDRERGRERRRMRRSGGGGRGMVALNSAGNQLVKLNIKKTGMIVCGKAICLQLATSRITHSRAHINTFMPNGTRHVAGGAFMCACTSAVRDTYKSSKLINQTASRAIGEQLLQLSAALIESWLKGSCRTSQFLKT